MKRPSFFQNVFLALVLSGIAGLSFLVLSVVLPAGFLLKGIFTLIGGVYISFLLRQSDERTGRWVTVTLWALITGCVWFAGVPLLVFFGVQAGLIWLIRSLYYYSSLVSAFADMALSGVAFAAAIWATGETHSLFLAVWAFFLTQSLFVLIPKSLKTSPSKAQGGRFEDASRVAETALRKLSTQ